MRLKAVDMKGLHWVSVQRAWWQRASVHRWVTGACACPQCGSNRRRSRRSSSQLRTDPMQTEEAVILSPWPLTLWSEVSVTYAVWRSPKGHMTAMLFVPTNQSGQRGPQISVVPEIHPKTKCQYKYCINLCYTVVPCSTSQYTEVVCSTRQCSADNVVLWSCDQSKGEKLEWPPDETSGHTHLACAHTLSLCCLSVRENFHCSTRNRSSRLWSRDPVSWPQMGLFVHPTDLHQLKDVLKPKRWLFVCSDSEPSAQAEQPPFYYPVLWYLHICLEQNLRKCLASIKFWDFICAVCNFEELSGIVVTS